MNRDALDLLRTFIAHEVRFLLVGAHAVGFYAEPRATGDLDLLVEPTLENAARAYAALREFGAPLLDLAVEDLAYPGIVYQMGFAPYRIDILTEISGVSFEEAFHDHGTAYLQSLEVPVIAHNALIRNKQATGRPKDLLDLDLLRRHSRKEG
ncbi:MAG: hypothetical protein QOJ16_574 [Acidobacteriota bacterium]|nr:hypothetical protein [Acidobacteriota bacterium]